MSSPSPFANPRGIGHTRFSPDFPARRGRLLHAGRGNETLAGRTGINFSLPRWSACLEIYIRRTPYRIIAGVSGAVRDASLALMIERSRIFTFNIIESRSALSLFLSPPPLSLSLWQRERASERPRFVGRFQYAQLETAQFSRWLPCGDRGHAFLSSRCVNTLVCARLCLYGGIATQRRGTIDRPAKEDLVNYRREIRVRLNCCCLLETERHRQPRELVAEWIDCYRSVTIKIREEGPTKNFY